MGASTALEKPVALMPAEAHRLDPGVARELELDAHFAEVLPGGKASKIRELKERGLVVARTVIVAVNARLLRADPR